MSQLLGTIENLRNDARLPVGWNRPHNPKVAGSNPAPATKQELDLTRNRAGRPVEGIAKQDAFGGCVDARLSTAAVTVAAQGRLILETRSDRSDS